MVIGVVVGNAHAVNQAGAEQFGFFFGGMGAVCAVAD